MFPEFIFENSLENSRKSCSFEKYLECYILYVEGVLNFLFIAVSLTFWSIFSCTIHCFFNAVCESYSLKPDKILRYCLFLLFWLDKRCRSQKNFGGVRITYLCLPSDGHFLLGGWTMDDGWMDTWSTGVCMLCESRCWVPVRALLPTNSRLLTN